MSDDENNDIYVRVSIINYKILNVMQKLLDCFNIFTLESNFQSIIKQRFL